MRAGPGVPTRAGACKLGFPSFAGRAGVGETWGAPPSRSEALCFDRTEDQFTRLYVRLAGLIECIDI